METKLERSRTYGNGLIGGKTGSERWGIDGTVLDVAPGILPVLARFLGRNCSKEVNA